MLVNKLLRNCKKIVSEIQLEYLKNIGLKRNLETYYLNCFQSRKVEQVLKWIADCRKIGHE